MHALRKELDFQVGSFSEGLGAAPRLLAQSWFARHDLIGPSSTNQDTHDLPFQRWYRFKEAFAPRAVLDAFNQLPVRPRSCIDPFGGSGTTALTAQFLDIRPTTVEVNPFLADLIEAKLSAYEPEALMRSFRQVSDDAQTRRVEPEDMLSAAPPTFVEPGLNNRWIFGRAVASQILNYRAAIEDLTDVTHQRLFKVLLAASLVTLSNVVISGKGRRYRGGWEQRLVAVSQVARLFEAGFLRALEDIIRFGRRPCMDYTLLRGDVRQALEHAPPADFALFSPPYPNSFDYTDIYNLELWMLGYLRSPADNRALRQSTLRSHVQIRRDFEAAVRTPSLDRVLDQLEAKRTELWNRDIPEMVGAYFEDITTVLRGLHGRLSAGGSVMMVVGDSQYAGIPINVGSICVEVGAQNGFRLKGLSQMRSMRASAQQGGAYDLGETLVHLIRD